MISIDILSIIDDHPLFQKISIESREKLAACKERASFLESGLGESPLYCCRGSCSTLPD